MITPKSIRDIKFILENKEKLDISKQDAETLLECLKYAKAFVMQKIIQNSVRTDSNLISQIESEISRYGAEIRKLQDNLQTLEEEKLKIEEYREFKYPEFVPPERQEGISEDIQKAIEEKEREKYNQERFDAELEHDELVTRDAEEKIHKLENDIIKNQRQIANLSVLKEKYEKKDINKFLQTLKLSCNFSDEEYKKVINLCAEGMIYPNGEIEVARTPGHQEQLFVKSENGEEYLPNPEAIRGFVTFLNEHSKEIEEVNKIFVINDQENENMKKIENLKKEIMNREVLQEAIQNEGKNYEEYLREISDMIFEIKELRFKVNNSRLPAKQMGFFARLFARLFRHKKIDTSSIDKMETELNEKINMVKQKIKENEMKYSDVREAYHESLTKNLKNLEIPEYINENGLRINSQDWDIINSTPWLEQHKYDKIYEKLSKDNADANREIKMTENLIFTNRDKRDESIGKLSPEATIIYENSEYSNYWVNNKTQKRKERLPGKYLIGGLYDRYMKITGNDDKNEEEKLSPYVALKTLNAVLDIQKVETLEDAAKLGIIISEDNIEKCKKAIKYLEDEILRRVSEKVSLNIAKAQNNEEER